MSVIQIQIEKRTNATPMTTADAYSGEWSLRVTVFDDEPDKLIFSLHQSRVWQNHGFALNVEQATCLRDLLTEILGATAMVEEKQANPGEVLANKVIEACK